MWVSRVFSVLVVAGFFAYLSIVFFRILPLINPDLSVPPGEQAMVPLWPRGSEVEVLVFVSPMTMMEASLTSEGGQVIPSSVIAHGAGRLDWSDQIRIKFGFCMNRIGDECKKGHLSIPLQDEESSELQTMLSKSTIGSALLPFLLDAKHQEEAGERRWKWALNETAASSARRFAKSRGLPQLVAKGLGNREAVDRFNWVLTTERALFQPPYVHVLVRIVSKSLLSEQVLASKMKKMSPVQAGVRLGSILHTSAPFLRRTNWIPPHPRRYLLTDPAVEPSTDQLPPGQNPVDAPHIMTHIRVPLLYAEQLLPRNPDRLPHHLAGAFPPSVVSMGAWTSARFRARQYSTRTWAEWAKDVLGVDLFPSATLPTDTSSLQSALVESAPGTGEAYSAYGPLALANRAPPTRDALSHVNLTAGVVPMTVEVMPITLQRFLLAEHMLHGLETLEAAGVGQEERDDVIRLVTETPAWLLLTTMAVSMLHLLFDILALQEDVRFWSSAKTMKGIAPSTLIWQLVCDSIVTAFLVRQGSSLLVVLPTSASVVIDVWKCIRALGMELVWVGGFIPVASIPDQTKEAKEEERRTRHTKEYDFIATAHLAAFLLPLVVGAMVRSLVYDKYETFSDWLLFSAVGIVHSLSFVGMMPQLYVNYRLRSVAHMPWNVFIYRALNTFVDDLFAFVIRMPMLQRISVFRDDLVFILLLGQRFLYPVDPSRVASAHSFEDDDGGGSGEKKEKERVEEKGEKGRSNSTQTFSLVVVVDAKLWRANEGDGAEKKPATQTATPVIAEEHPLILAYPGSNGVTSLRQGMAIIGAIWNTSRPITARIPRPSFATAIPTSFTTTHKDEERELRYPMSKELCLLLEMDADTPKNFHCFREQLRAYVAMDREDSPFMPSLLHPFEDVPVGMMRLLNDTGVLQSRRVRWAAAPRSAGETSNIARSQNDIVRTETMDVWRLQRDACRFGQPPCSRISSAVWTQSVKQWAKKTPRKGLDALERRGRECAHRKSFRFYMYEAEKGTVERGIIERWRSILEPRISADLTWTDVEDELPEEARNPKSGFAYAALYFTLATHPARTTNPEDACVLFPMSVDTLCVSNTCRRSPAELSAALAALPHWRGGRDHLVFGFSDHEYEVDIGAAMWVVSSVGPTWDRAFIEPKNPTALPLLQKERPNFDIIFPLTFFRCFRHPFSHMSRWVSLRNRTTSVVVDDPRGPAETLLSLPRFALPWPSHSVGSDAANASLGARVSAAHATRYHLDGDTPIPGSRATPLDRSYWEGAGMVGKQLHRIPSTPKSKGFVKPDSFLWTDEDGVGNGEEELRNDEGVQGALEGGAKAILDAVDSATSSFLGLFLPKSATTMRGLSLKEEMEEVEVEKVKGEGKIGDDGEFGRGDSWAPLYDPVDPNRGASNAAPGGPRGRAWPPLWHRVSPGTGRKLLLSFRGAAYSLPSDHPGAARVLLRQAAHNGIDVKIILECTSTSPRCTDGEMQRFSLFGSHKEWVDTASRILLGDGGMEPAAACAQWEQEAALPEHDFDTLTLESDFAAVMSGEGTHSYRLLEVLQLGAIPVIVGPAALPFPELIHWSRIAVIARDTSKPSLLRLPMRLRSIPPHHRQAMFREGQRTYWALLASLGLQVDALFETIRFRYERVVRGADQPWLSGGLPVFSAAAPLAASSSVESWAEAVLVSHTLHNAVLDPEFQAPVSSFPPNTTSLPSTVSSTDTSIATTPSSPSLTPPAPPSQQEAMTALAKPMDLDKMATLSVDVVLPDSPLSPPMLPTEFLSLETIAARATREPLRNILSRFLKVAGGTLTHAGGVPTALEMMARVVAIVKLEMYQPHLQGTVVLDQNVARGALAMLQRSRAQIEAGRLRDGLTGVERSRRLLLPTPTAATQRPAIGGLLHLIAAELCAEVGATRAAVSQSQVGFLYIGLVYERFGTDALLRGALGMQWYQAIALLKSKRLAWEVFWGARPGLEPRRRLGARPPKPRNIVQSDILPGPAPLVLPHENEALEVGNGEGEIRAIHTFLPSSYAPVDEGVDVDGEIVIVSLCAYDGEASPVLSQASIANKAAWCRLHGYDCRLETQGAQRRQWGLKRPAAWYKVPLVAKHLARGDWVVWMDCDTLVSNPTEADVRATLRVAGAYLGPSEVKLDAKASAGELLDAPCPQTGPLFVASEDGTMLNTGWFALRGRCGWSLKFLRDLFGPMEDVSNYDTLLGPLQALSPHEYLERFAFEATMLLRNHSIVHEHQPPSLHGPPLPLEYTFAVIKPGALKEHAESIERVIQSHGFAIVERIQRKLSKQEAEEFYIEHASRPFFGVLTDFMSSSEVLLMILARPDAVRAWRALLGPTSPTDAIKQAPTSIRARFGTDRMHNAAHGSESVSAAVREIRLFFPHFNPDPPAQDPAVTGIPSTPPTIHTSPFATHPFWEQAAAVYLLVAHPDAADRAARTAILPQWAVNSYPLPLAAQLPAIDLDAALTALDMASLPTSCTTHPILCESEAWTTIPLHHPWIAGDPYVALSGCGMLLGSTHCDAFTNDIADAADLLMATEKSQRGTIALYNLQSSFLRTGAVGRLAKSRPDK